MDKKSIYNTLSLVSLAVLGYSGWKLFKLFKNGNVEQQSNFGGENYKQIVFTLTNNTNQNQVQYLFDSYSNQNNPNVGVVGNLSFFNRELLNKPKKLYRVEFRNIGLSNFSNFTPTPSTPVTHPTPLTPSVPISPRGSGHASTPIPPVAPILAPPLVTPPPVAPILTPLTTPAYNQAEAPFKMNCKDANGNASLQQFIPMISTTQFQKGITSVDMGGRVLDGECFMEYTMYPNSKVAIVLFYEDFPISKLLTKKSKKQLILTK